MCRLYFWFKFIYTANLQVYCLALLGLQNMHAGIAIEQNWRWLVIRCRHWKKRGKKKEKRNYRLERSSVHKVLSKHEDLSSSSRTQITDDDDDDDDDTPDRVVYTAKGATGWLLVLASQQAPQISEFQPQLKNSLTKFNVDHNWRSTPTVNGYAPLKAHRHQCAWHTQTPKYRGYLEGWDFAVSKERRLYGNSVVVWWLCSMALGGSRETWILC